MNLLLILTIILLLIAINGLYVAAEFSTVSAKRSRLAQLADNGDQGAQRMLTIVTDRISWMPILPLANLASPCQACCWVSMGNLTSRY
jgi:Mg2+/Co2+ transporter CorB